MERVVARRPPWVDVGLSCTNRFGGTPRASSRGEQQLLREVLLPDSVDRIVSGSKRERVAAYRRSARGYSLLWTPGTVAPQPSEQPAHIRPVENVHLSRG